MKARERVNLTLSPEVFALLVYEAQKQGTPVARYAAHKVYQAVLPALNTREYERWRKEQGLERYKSTLRAEQRMIARMHEVEQGAQTWTEQPTASTRSRA